MKVAVIDDLAPEDAAMLQALYSRSPASVDSHLEKVRASGSGRFIDRYYVGYGHDSIGDCATTAVFVEDVSFLAAKAVQDWPLYSGQEASTRFMKFSAAGFENPLGTDEGAETQRRWLDAYLRATSEVRAYQALKRPRREGESEVEYERALGARTFDVVRSLLPAGARTNLSWTTNLRQLRDKLAWLDAHPSEEVRRVAAGIFEAVSRKYPHSFTRRDGAAPAATWRGAASAAGYYLLPHAALPVALDQTPSSRRPWDDSGWTPVCVRFRLDDELLPEALAALRGRPSRAAPPHWTAEAGTARSDFLLDYGSFRDVQRHRAGVCRMPLLTVDLGFHSWYLNEMPPALRPRVLELLRVQEAFVRGVADRVAAQSYASLGHMVRCRIVQPLSAFIYRVELRTQETVHPTLRDVAVAEARQFGRVFPDVPLHVNLEPDVWSVKRGGQDIREV